MRIHHQVEWFDGGGTADSLEVKLNVRHNSVAAKVGRVPRPLRLVVTKGGCSSRV